MIYVWKVIEAQVPIPMSPAEGVSRLSTTQDLAEPSVEN